MHLNTVTLNRDTSFYFPFWNYTWKALNMASGKICAFRMSSIPWSYLFADTLQIEYKLNVPQINQEFTQWYQIEGKVAFAQKNYTWPADLAHSWFIRWVLVNNHLVAFIDLVRLLKCGFELRTWWRWSHHPHLQKELKNNVH